MIMFRPAALSFARQVRPGTTTATWFRSGTMACASTRATSDDSSFPVIGTAAAALFLGAVATATSSTACEEPVQKEPLNEEDLPEYTSKKVAENDGKDGKPIWMSYGGMVYDATKFIANHPGGSEKIMEAAGGAIEPFWHLYRQHFATDLPQQLMEDMVIGTLCDKDQESIDEKMEVMNEKDPYAKEPLRHASLTVHSDTPMNAEPPSHLLTESYLTPASLFYLRHHHPVPFMSQKEVKEYKLTVDLTRYGKGILEIGLEDLKKLPKTEIVSVLQCSGNRRGDFNEFKRTSGTSWGQGAIGCAKWGGVKLSEVLKLAGLDDPIHAQENGGMEHVRFHAQDGMTASIGIEKAMNPYGDCLLAYEMNDEPLPRDHGFPVRAMVPGYAAVRNVKWLHKIELAETESEGPWQRGLNYKTLPPSVTDASSIKLDKMPSMTEVAVFSGITSTLILTPGKAKPGDVVSVRCKGWAWAGGGRNIVRVDVTGTNGQSWGTAELKEGAEQRFGRAWAWTFWECDVQATVGPDGKIDLASKAVDLAHNVQPENCGPSWNVRGLGNNSWYRTSMNV